MRAVSQRELICTAPWTTLEVTDFDGRVHQCDKSWTLGDRGQLAGNSLQALWNGPGYRAARRSMAAHDTDRLCRSICPRLRDGRYAPSRLRPYGRSAIFVENQRLLREDVAERREEMRALPLRMSLCPSSYCNYDCIMCDYGRTARRDLPSHVWEELAELLPTLGELNLHGGEPLACADVMKFLREMDSARYPDLRVNLITNGSLLTERALAHMRGCAFGEVTVSLNAGSADVYARVQRGIAFEDVLENVDALVRFRDSQPAGFNVALGFVVQPANAETIVDFARLARARRLPIQLRPLAPDTPDGLARRFYGDPSAVAEVLAHLENMREYAAAEQPEWIAQVDSMKQAIEAQAKDERRLPLLS